MTTIFPYISKSYETKKSREELISSLKSMTYEDAGWGFYFLGTDGKPYRGIVKYADFKIRPAIRYRNSFIPIVHGQIEEKEESTLVTVEVKLYASIRVIMTIWCLFSISWILTALIVIFRDGPGAIGSLVIGVASLWLARSFMRWGFGRESDQVCRDLDDLFA